MSRFALLLLLCLLLVACGDEAPVTVTPLPTSAPPTQTPVVIVVVVTATPAPTDSPLVIVVTATPEPTKAARPALAATSAPTPPPATASATASPTAPATIAPTDTAVSSSPTRTVTPAVTATPCGNLAAMEWVEQVHQFNADLLGLWYTVSNPAADSGEMLARWHTRIVDARALVAPAGYEKAGGEWRAMLDTLDQIPAVKTKQQRKTLWDSAQNSYTQLTADWRAERDLECGTPAH